MEAARQIRDRYHGARITYSPKVFVPLTMLCRDACGYCTFAQPPARLEQPFLSPDQVLAIMQDELEQLKFPGKVVIVRFRKSK